MSAAVDISVILATRNRAARVREVLRALAAQETGGRFTYEVLIADNGSADTTRQVVEQQAGGYPVPLRYVFEGRTGKPWALNTAMTQAQGELFAFLDDDVDVTPVWLRELWACAQEEQADAVSGKIVPKWLDPRPAWLTDEAFWTIGSMGCIDHGSARRSSLDGQDCRWVGGNMAIRRTVFEQLGGNDVRMARGQDTEYYLRCLKRGVKVCYAPSALAYHLISGERMKPAHFRQWHHRQGQVMAQLMPWKLTHLITVMPVWRYGKLARHIEAYLHHRLSRGPWWKQFYYELQLRQELSKWKARWIAWPGQVGRWFAGRFQPSDKTPRQVV